MIELMVPHKIKPTAKVMGIRMGNAYHSVDLGDQERIIISDLRELYGFWFKENNITNYKLAVRTIFNKDESIILLSMIQFYDDEDAMAFKLVWL